MSTEHINALIRAQLAEYLDVAILRSKDQRGEIIHLVDGRLEATIIALKDFDWANYKNVLAFSFVLVTDDPEEHARFLFSPQNLAWCASNGPYHKE